MSEAEQLSLEERCFLIGLNSEKLPSKEEMPVINREYFKMGVKVSELKSYKRRAFMEYVIFISSPSYHFPKEEWTPKEKERINISLFETLEYVEKDYQNLLKIVEQYPLIKKHQEENTQRWREQIKEYLKKVDEIFQGEDPRTYILEPEN